MLFILRETENWNTLTRREQEIPLLSGGMNCD